MNEQINNINKKNKEISLIDIINGVKKSWNYLLTKWIIICVFGFSGAAIGLVASFLVKPKYTAHLSFALIEKNTGGGGLADLASSFGISGLGGNNSSAFSGDNLLEIIKSRYAVEQTLLTPVKYKGVTKTLVEVYIDFTEMRKDWQKNKKNIELQRLSYPVGQKRETFTRTQDSVLYTIYDNIIQSQSLVIARKDKKISIVNVDFKSKDEIFSKLFVETLMDQTYKFYRETKTSQSRANINMMQHTADSIKSLYEGALYKGAGYSQVNINPALQFAAVPHIKQENNAQLYATVYAEVLKNLETLKLDLARETPIVQMIDTPRFPLKKEKLGKVFGIILGGLLGGLLIVAFLLGRLFINEVSKNNS
jgi:LPS O-antigen subunit length determinant protein (WzzB/FepE family)